MNEYRHHVAGLFAHREEAAGVFSRLVERGLHGGQRSVNAVLLETRSMPFRVGTSEP